MFNPKDKITETFVLTIEVCKEFDNMIRSHRIGKKPRKSLE